MTSPKSNKTSYLLKEINFELNEINESLKHNNYSKAEEDLILLNTITSKQHIKAKLEIYCLLNYLYWKVGKIKDLFFISAHLLKLWIKIASNTSYSGINNSKYSHILNDFQLKLKIIKAFFRVGNVFFYINEKIYSFVYYYYSLNVFSFVNYSTNNEFDECNNISTLNTLVSQSMNKDNNSMCNEYKEQVELKYISVLEEISLLLCNEENRVYLVSESSFKLGNNEINLFTTKNNNTNLNSNPNNDIINNNNNNNDNENNTNNTTKNNITNTNYSNIMKNILLYFNLKENKSKYTLDNKEVILSSINVALNNQCSTIVNKIKKITTAPNLTSFKSINKSNNKDINDITNNSKILDKQEQFYLISTSYITYLLAYLLLFKQTSKKLRYSRKNFCRIITSCLSNSVNQELLGTFPGPINNFFIVNHKTSFYELKKLENYNRNNKLLQQLIYIKESINTINNNYLNSNSNKDAYFGKSLEFEDNIFGNSCNYIQNNNFNNSTNLGLNNASIIKEIFKSLSLNDSFSLLNSCEFIKDYIIVEHDVFELMKKAYSCFYVLEKNIKYSCFSFNDKIINDLNNNSKVKRNTTTSSSVAFTPKISDVFGSFDIRTVFISRLLLTESLEFIGPRHLNIKNLNSSIIDIKKSVLKAIDYEYYKSCSSIEIRVFIVNKQEIQEVVNMIKAFINLSLYYKLKAKEITNNDKDSLLTAIETNFPNMFKNKSITNDDSVTKDKENNNSTYYNYITNPTLKLSSILSNFLLIFEILTNHDKEDNKSFFIKTIKPIETFCSLCKKAILLSNSESCNFCSIVIYCSDICREADYKHIVFHNKISSINNKIKALRNDNITKFAHSDAKLGLCGLKNLDNTCYINSAVQCLSNCIELTNYFLLNYYKQDLNRRNKMGSGGQVALAYFDLLQKLWLEKNEYVSPINFRRVFGDVVKFFSDSNQHDSPEMLAFLLDILHEDLKRSNFSYSNKNLNIYNVKDSGNDKDEEDNNFSSISKNKINKQALNAFINYNNNNNDVNLVMPNTNSNTNTMSISVKNEFELATNSWEQYIKVEDSIIVDLFHGQYKNQIYCPKCETISTTFDPFVVFPLNIPVSTVKINFKIFLRSKDIEFPDDLIIVEISIDERSSIHSIKETLLNKIFDIKDEYLSKTNINAQANTNYKEVYNNNLSSFNNIHLNPNSNRNSHRNSHTRISNSSNKNNLINTNLSTINQSNLISYITNNKGFKRLCNDDDLISNIYSILMKDGIPTNKTNYLYHNKIHKSEKYEKYNSNNNINHPISDTDSSLDLDAVDFVNNPFFDSYNEIIFYQTLPEQEGLYTIYLQPFLYQEYKSFIIKSTPVSFPLFYIRPFYFTGNQTIKDLYLSAFSYYRKQCQDSFEKRTYNKFRNKIKSNEYVNEEFNIYFDISFNSNSNSKSNDKKDKQIINNGPFRFKHFNTNPTSICCFCKKYCQNCSFNFSLTDNISTMFSKSKNNYMVMIIEFPEDKLLLQEKTNMNNNNDNNKNYDKYNDIKFNNQYLNEIQEVTNEYTETNNSKMINSLVQEKKKKDYNSFLLYEKPKNSFFNINNFLIKDKISLYDCLDLFKVEEQLDKNNSWYCSSCKNHVQAFKKLEISRLPYILIIQLKRFKMDNSKSAFKNNVSKNNSFINFPIEDLNLKNYLIKDAEKFFKSNTGNYSSRINNKNNIYSHNDLDNNNLKKKKEEDLNLSTCYDLFAVILHSGSLKEGHYLSICKNKTNWIFYDDQNIEIIDPSLINNSYAYMLFYRKKG